MRRSFSSGFLALGVIGIFYAWKNRYEIQSFLERQGINTPLDTSSVASTFRSGLARVTGSVRNEADPISSSASEAIDNASRQAV